MRLTSSSDSSWRTLFLGVKSIKSIPRTLVDTVDTFRRSPLTPHMLSAFTLISDGTRKYFAIRVCTGYYRVGHSPLLLYYELLIIPTSYSVFAIQNLSILFNSLWNAVYIIIFVLSCCVRSGVFTLLKFTCK